MARLILWVVATVCFLVTYTNAQASGTSLSPAESSAAVASVNVANVPDCAKVCLSNSTQYATDCAQIDVQCLCNSQSYVSALSCCLATNCNTADQQTAIQFNIQECAAVNSTAPSFVGCSPFSLTSGGASSRTNSVSASDNAGATTLSTDLATLVAQYTNTKIVTASFTGQPILTGACTVPLFAQVTERTGNILKFPLVGCALNRGNCCPYDPQTYFGLTKCPSDYYTTAGACCPSGYSVYATPYGAETPCYSKPTKTYLPASTTTGAPVILITDTVFSKRYPLIETAPSQVPPGGIVGIVLGGCLLIFGTPALLLWLLRKRKAKENEEKQNGGATFPPVEPGFPVDGQQVSGIPASAAPQSPSELASPETGVNTPTTTKGLPYQSGSARSPPPTYEVPAAVPLEMPGSTYMHEHHPAYSASSTDLTLRTPPRSPPHSPSVTASTRSPVLSPTSPFRTDSPSNTNNFVITPLGSPRFREDTT